MRCQPPGEGGLGEGERPLEVEPTTAMWAAGAEGTACPPKATGCPEEADHTWEGGAAGPLDLPSADTVDTI